MRTSTRGRCLGRVRLRGGGSGGEEIEPGVEEEVEEESGCGWCEGSGGWKEWQSDLVGGACGGGGGATGAGPGP